MSDNPMVALNHAIAAAMVHGPRGGPRAARRARRRRARSPATTASTPCARTCSRCAGDRQAAIAHYRAAAERTASLPERNYLTTQAARLAAAGE